MAITPKRRRAIFAAHGGACHYCGSNDATHIDHIVPRAAGGTDDLGNLIAACLTCNLRKFRHRLPADAERRALDAAEAKRSAIEATMQVWVRPNKIPNAKIVIMMIAPDRLARIDQWRSEQPDTPCRAEAVRRLVLIGVKAG
jgi:hypothetical protein